MKRLAVLLLLLAVAPLAHATVNEVPPFRTDHIASGSGTIFAYTFKILEKTQILVLVNGIEVFVDANYSVQGVGNSGGGTVTFASPPTNGSTIALIRQQPVQQLSIYTANEAFPATRLMTDLDKNIMVDQMQEEALGRALKFGKESLFRDITVSDPVALGCLSWNAEVTRVVSVPCGSGGGGSGDVPAITPGHVVFGGASTELSQDTSGGFYWDNAAKRLKIARGMHTGNDFTIHKDGLFYTFLKNSDNISGYQGMLSILHNGEPADTLTTIGNDKVAIGGWTKRGAGGTSPIYGGNFGVVFTTPGVANGVEIDVQNGSDTANIGQGLWINGSCVGPADGGGCANRSNAILIDTQDQTKWETGILFKEGFVAGGATGSINGIGIFFNQNQSADFIVIQPRVDTNTNVAIKITDSAFTLNKFELLNNGTIRGYGTSTSAAFPSFSFTDDIDTGMYLEAANTLGWGAGGTRRMTLGAALNVWPSSVDTGLTGTINLFDSTSVHSVGFMAADAIGTSFRYRLPDTPGTNGQCLATDGASPIATLSYTACSGSGGAGTVTVTGSPVTGGLAIVSGATSITSGVLSGDATTPTNSLVVTLKNTGTAGTYGLTTTDAQGRVTAGTIINDVPHGGIGVATLAANGVLYGNGAGVVLVTAQGGANTVLTANAGAPAFSSTPTIASITTTAQGAVVIGAYGGSANQTGELRFVERTATTDYVGFRAPDAITTSVIWTLPATDSTGTQCLASNGSGVLSWGACSAGSGTGLTSLGGLVGSTQTFGNDDNVTMASGGTTHTITWVGQLSPLRGGTGQNTSSSNGVPTISAGTWSVLAQLPKSLGGTGTSGGTSGRVPFWGSTTLTDHANLTYDVGNTTLSIGATGTGVPTAGATALMVSATANSQSVARIESFTNAAATLAQTALQLVRTTASGAGMGTGFGVRQDFILRDNSNVDNIAARFLVSRDTIGDTSSRFVIQTNVAGSLEDRFIINDSGQGFWNPNSNVGTFGFLANGSRTTEVAFFTPNNANSVAFVAPASTTGGNHVWRLPTTFGAAGSVLTNSGTGDLSWGSSTITGSSSTGRATYWSSSSALTGLAGIIHAAAYGTTRANVQQAIDAAPTGGIVQLDCAVYDFTSSSTALSITKSLTVQGCGSESTHIGLQAGATGFDINTNGRVTIRGMSVSLGAIAIHSRHTTGNAGSLFTELALNSQTTAGIKMEGNSNQWTIDRNIIQGGTTYGIWITADNDSCECMIRGNNIVMTSGTAGIKAEGGGDVRIIDNKFLGSSTSMIHLSKGTIISTSEIVIVGNVISAQGAHAILIDNVSASCNPGGSTGCLAGVVIVGNQINGSTTSVVKIDGLGFGFVNITANHISSAGTKGLDLVRLNQFQVSSNYMVGQGGSDTGITTGSNATNGHIFGNTLSGYTTNYSGTGGTGTLIGVTDANYMNGIRMN